ncbi:MAG: hypothetical protein SGPRY_001747 [Prymnesium sp.]
MRASHPSHPLPPEMLFEENRSVESPLLDGKSGKSWLRRSLPFALGAALLLALAAVLTQLRSGGDPIGSPLQNISNEPRLRIRNGCKSDSLWIANFAFQTAYFPQDLELQAGQVRDFMIPREGLAATRFWAKWGCDKQGANCKIGESGGPGESCPPTGCAPPIDSKVRRTRRQLAHRSIAPSSY